MVVLESCPKHNMVAYLEKTDANAEFHQIIDFLARSFIHNALTAHYCQSNWQACVYSEASIRSDLLFDDADGIDSLPNQAIFDAIQLMGHLDAKKKFVMYPRFISIFLDKQLKDVPVPLDHFPVNALTCKVFSFMVKKGKHFSRKVTPLFPNMLVQPTEDEGAESERPPEPQPSPSPSHSSEVHVEPQSDPSPRPSPTTHISDSIPEDSGGNHGGQSSSDRSLSENKGDMTLQNQEAKEESQTCYCTPQSLGKECLLEANIGKKEVLKEKVDAKGVCIQIRECRIDSLQPWLLDAEPRSRRTHNTAVDRKEREEQSKHTQAKKKFKQLARDEEMARKVQEDWEAEEEVKKLAKEEAIKAALSNEYDFIQARIEADRLLALRLQDEEREQFTVEREQKFPS
ncbi:hypothetical protein Tco_0461953 [Tanacetum coccineum]